MDFRFFRMRGVAAHIGAHPWDPCTFGNVTVVAVGVLSPEAEKEPYFVTVPISPESPVATSEASLVH